MANSLLISYPKALLLWWDVWLSTLDAECLIFLDQRPLCCLVLFCFMACYGSWHKVIVQHEKDMAFYNPLGLPCHCVSVYVVFLSRVYFGSTTLLNKFFWICIIIEQRLAIAKLEEMQSDNMFNEYITITFKSWRKNLRTLNVFPEHVHKMNSFEKCYHGKVIILVLNFLYKFFMFYLWFKKIFVVYC